MSVKVPLAELRAQTARFGNAPYLLSQGDDGRPHAVAVAVAWQGTDIVSSSGTRSAKNVGAHPLVSLLWPPVESGGYSLIVDGDGHVTGEGETRLIVIAPTHGVLHRPGLPSAQSTSGCSSDCVPLLG